MLFFYRPTDPLVISEVTVHVWLSHSDKTNNVAFTGPLVLWLSVGWLYMFDCPTVTKPTNCLSRTTGPLVISEVTVHVWLSHSDKTNNVAFTGQLVLWQSVRWLYMFDCLTVTKPTMSFLHDHWLSCNQWGDCTCLIVSQWQNQQFCFYRTTGPLVISEVIAHVW